jgi:hypothetical protein
MARKKKLPYFVRYIRYCLNLIFLLAFPTGIEEDDFTKQMKSKYKKNDSN